MKKKRENLIGKRGLLIPKKRDLLINKKPKHDKKMSFSGLFYQKAPFFFGSKMSFWRFDRKKRVK